MSSNFTCRDSWIHSLDYDSFVKLTCAKCFVQLFQNSKALTINWPLVHPFNLYMHKHNGSEIYEADASNLNSKICKSFLEPDECQKWRTCCREASKCCTQLQKEERGNDTLQCPGTWDGISCWPITLSNTLIKAECPYYYQAERSIFDRGQAEKYCQNNGTWFIHSELQIEYTEYSKCFDTSKTESILEASLIVDFVGHSLGVTLLCISIFFILSFRNLRRDLLNKESLRLHLNLFFALLGLSLTMGNFHIIYYDALKNPLSGIYSKNPVWCRILHSSMIYFRCASYMAMFCQGLYLYRKVSNMRKMGYTDSTAKYFFLTWGIPIVSTVTYTSLRFGIPKLNLDCWIGQGLSYYELIYMIPNNIFLFLNMCFLISIEVNLWRQMQADKNDKRIKILRHAMKATLYMLPVFGVQFIFIIYRPKRWPIWEIIGAIITSTQGISVSILYCFSSKEVRQEVISQISNSNSELKHVCCCSSFTLLGKTKSSTFKASNTKSTKDCKPTEHVGIDAKHRIEQAAFINENGFRDSNEEKEALSSTFKVDVELCTTSNETTALNEQYIQCDV